MAEPPEVRQLIERYQLEPLPGEGGFFRRIFTHPESLPPLRHHPDPPQEGRALASAIYFLITAEAFSALHRIDSEEHFCFLAGDRARMLQLDASTGEWAFRRLGPATDSGCEPWVRVPAGLWQGLRLEPGGRWALLVVFVSPEFAWEHFELADREELLRRFPSGSEAIRAYTRIPHPE